jgi:hypothetical protein
MSNISDNFKSDLTNLRNAVNDTIQKSNSFLNSGSRIPKVVIQRINKLLSSLNSSLSNDKNTIVSVNTTLSFEYNENNNASILSNINTLLTSPNVKDIYTSQNNLQYLINYQVNPQIKIIKTDIVNFSTNQSIALIQSLTQLSSYVKTILNNILQNNILPEKTQSKTKYSNNKYSNDISQSIDIQYHPNEQQLLANAAATDVTFGNTLIYDNTGKVISYPSSSVQGNITYYTPGSYPFGTANYVPNYENTMYLSRLTGISTTSAVYNTEKMANGFCSYFENDPLQQEKMCNKLNPHECSSTSCCVTLGGSKCVAGNESGPFFNINYSDAFLLNKDYYYYQRKCYGNCTR